MNSTVDNAIIKSSIAVTKGVAIDERYGYGLYVENGGTVVITFRDGTTDTYVVPDYTTIHVEIAEVGAASTASGIHALKFYR